MTNINIINPGAIDAWLLEVASAPVAELLSIGLKRHLLKDIRTAEWLNRLPDDAPDWAKNKWDVCGPFSIHRFAPKKKIEIYVKLKHIIDWVISMHANNDLGELVGGKPKVLLHIQSIDDAHAQAEKYFSALNKKFAKAASQDEDGIDIKTVLDFGDGMKIVEILTPDGLKREGMNMRHCVGGGAYDEDVKNNTIKIFSLRDDTNKPHATFEVEVADNALLQCKGKENAPATKKYMPYVERFVRDGKFKLMEHSSYTSLVQTDNGAIYSIYAMPKNLTLHKSLDLYGCIGLTQLPDNLTVSGDLDLNKCMSLTRLPGNLTVGRDLYLNYCTGLTQLPDKIDVKGTIIMPDGSEFSGADWPKARAHWMKKNAEAAVAGVKKTTSPLLQYNP